MFDYTIALYEKDSHGAWGWHELADWTRPFTDGTRLDETLDGGSINVSCTTRKRPIKPFTRLRIIITENSEAEPSTYTEIGRIYRLVSSSKRTQRTFTKMQYEDEYGEEQEGYLYDWTINTIELTKLLERRLISTMTTTKYLIKNGQDYPTVLMKPVSMGSDGPGAEADGFVANYTLSTPCLLGYAILIPAANEIFTLPDNTLLQRWSWKSCTITLKDENGAVLHTETNENGYTPQFYYTPTGTGTIQLVFNIKLWITNPILPTDSTNPAQYSVEPYQCFIEVVNATTVKQQPTITSVCERLLESGVCIRKGVEEQEFTLDPTFAAEYADDLAPEFSFTNCTLFEALLQVGKKIHAIPRLVPRSNTHDTHYYVTFDKLGGSELVPVSLRAIETYNYRGEWEATTRYIYNDLVEYEGGYYLQTDPQISVIGVPPTVATAYWDEIQYTPPIYEETTTDANDWCGKVDSPSQNICNTEDVTGGAITEVGTSYVTVRTEDAQVEINADDIIIRTSKPIQQIVKVECGYISDYASGNTPVGDITPYVYEGAEYKTLSSYWGAAYPFSKGWAIYYNQGDNKIQGLSFRLTGRSADDNSYFRYYAIVNIINAKTGSHYSVGDGEWMRKLNFRVTYVPIAQTRLTARKQCLTEGGEGNNSLTYNQGTNVAETSYYGEAMRGASIRLGQDVETRTFDFFSLKGSINNLPKCGQILDGKYIATIDTEYDIAKIRVTMTLTNYNMLSQYVGLDSNYRLYDISEKQSVERNVNYNELVVVGDAPKVNMVDYLMNKNVREMIAYTVVGTAPRQYKMRVAKLTPYDANSQEIPNRATILPVVAFPFGTSICLNFSYSDNYGAGYQQTDTYEHETNKAVQRLVPYTDKFGEIKYLKVSFDTTTGWTQEDASAFDDDTPAMLYPQLTTPDNQSTGTDDVRTDAHYIDLSKDSREQINFTYQLHFVTTRKSIVIGSGISKYNPFIKVQSSGLTKVLWLTHTISTLNRYIDSTDAVITNSPGVGTSTNKVTYSAGECPIDNCKAYAVCKQVTINGETAYELLFGENFDDGIENGEDAPTLTFAGALEQACLTDYASCLKFAKSGTKYYSAGITQMTEQGTIAADRIVGADLDTQGGLIGINWFLFAKLRGSNYYVKVDDLVTAYDL